MENKSLLVNCYDDSLVLTEAKTYIKSQKSLNLISKACKYAKEKHGNQKRANGDAYIVHPISAAYYLTLWRMDPATICAGLLHDTLEDTPITYDDLVNNFGSEIADLVEAVTKVSHFAKLQRNELKAIYLRKLYLSMAKDIRVIIVKLADRLHNMRTISNLPDYKQKIIAQETLEVYAPIANRLGMSKVKSELDDLSFEVINVNEYNKIKTYLINNWSSQESLIKNYISNVKRMILNFPRIKLLEVYGRNKSIYSIYYKMNFKNKPIDDIQDLLAIRVIVKTVDDCYAVLGILHQKFTPIPGRFKDYISVPKNNLYQSLHTTLVMDSHIFEVQIRTKVMDEFAESGAAAHWMYKENSNFDPKKKQEEVEKSLNLFKDILDWADTKNNFEDSRELEQNLNTTNSTIKDAIAKRISHELISETIYVLTPEKKVITLPNGSTILDFAYRIHTDIGNTTIAGIVNGNHVPLNYVLKSGNIVQIKTNKSVKPSENWLNIVKSSYAKQKIRRAIKKIKESELEQKSEKEENSATKIKELKFEVEKYIQENNFKSKVVANDIVKMRLKQEKFNTYYDYLESAINKKISAKEIAEELFITPPSNELLEKIIKQKSHNTLVTKNNLGVQVEGINNIKLSFASCCEPIPFDEIIGIVTKTNGIKIHNKLCKNIIYDPKQIDVIWSDNADNDLILYKTTINCRVYDRPSLLTDIFNLMNRTNINIEKINVKQRKQRSSYIKIINIKLKINSLVNLNKLISSLNQVPDVISVKRSLNILQN